MREQPVETAAARKNRGLHTGGCLIGILGHPFLPYRREENRDRETDRDRGMRWNGEKL